MRIAIYILLFSIGIGSISACRQLNFTSDQEFLRKQDFIFLLFWSPDKLPENHADIVNAANNLKLEDLRNLPVNQDAVEEFIARYNNNGLLPRGRCGTTFNLGHLAEIANVINILYSAEDFDTFATLSLWTSQQVNSILWFFEAIITVFHREDTQHIRGPAVHEALPNYFYNRDVINQLNDFKSNPDCSAKKLIIANYSTVVSQLEGDDPESKITYFTEDVGIANYYAYMNLDLPFPLNSSYYNIPGYHRGERYYNDLRQFLARYYLERVSNDIGPIKNIDFNRKLPTGYYPDMEDYNGVIFAQRPANASIQNDKLQFVQYAEDYEERLFDAADRSALLQTDGEEREASDDPDFFTHFMDAVQGNADSINLNYYGSLEYVSRNILGFSPITDNFHVFMNAMLNYHADVRDPALYQLFKKIVNIGDRYKIHLPVYTKKDLDFSGVSLEEISIDNITTYFDIYESLGGYQTCGNDKQEILIHQKRLNHDDFSINLKINAEENVKAIVRIFIGPRYNRNNSELNVPNVRNGYFQFDQFIVDLESGVNQIERKDCDFSIQVPDEIRSDYFLEKIENAFINNTQFGFFERPYGFPRRLLVPRGKPDGLELSIFVIVNSIDESHIVITNTQVTGKELFDGRPLGFPFDRRIDSFRFNTANMAFKNILVFHND